jgi:hypothetical protein
MAFWFYDMPFSYYIYIETILFGGRSIFITNKDPTFISNFEIFNIIFASKLLIYLYIELKYPNK